MVTSAPRMKAGTVPAPPAAAPPGEVPLLACPPAGAPPPLATPPAGAPAIAFGPPAAPCPPVVFGPPTPPPVLLPLVEVPAAAKAPALPPGLGELLHAVEPHTS